jgi:hypothetical protein
MAIGGRDLRYELRLSQCSRLPAMRTTLIPAMRLRRINGIT